MIELDQKARLSQAQALAIANRAIQFGASEAARSAYPGLLESFLQPPPPQPDATGRWIITVAFASMAGALLGWLAPALVAAAIVAVASYYLFEHNPHSGHSATVHRMMRRW
jgi:hypothetical protein